MPRNPITIEVLETLDAIDRRGSFAKAAEELDKATSAVSYTVQKLEEQLEITVFQRQGRRSVLTQAGKVLLAEGREILKNTSRLADIAREVATGWEPRIRIAVESMQPLEPVFAAINEFLSHHPTIELDITEVVLNGGWELLDQDQTDLIIGSPGPAPRQKGYRLVKVAPPGLIPVIASRHPMANQAKKVAADELLPNLRAVITHDTSTIDVARSAGITQDGKQLFVRNVEQKLAAILAGIGVGHLPQHLIKAHLKSGQLIELDYSVKPNHEHFIAWQLSNKGRGLRALTDCLIPKLQVK